MVLHLVDKATLGLSLGHAWKHILQLENFGFLTLETVKINCLLCFGGVVLLSGSLNHLILFQLSLLLLHRKVWQHFGQIQRRNRLLIFILTSTSFVWVCESSWHGLRGKWRHALTRINAVRLAEIVYFNWVLLNGNFNLILNIFL